VGPALSLVAQLAHAHRASTTDHRQFCASIAEESRPIPQIVRHTWLIVRCRRGYQIPSALPSPSPINQFFVPVNSACLWSQWSLAMKLPWNVCASVGVVPKIMRFSHRPTFNKKICASWQQHRGPLGLVPGSPDIPSGGGGRRRWTSSF
jgi:hypothetical protein